MNQSLTVTAIVVQLLDQRLQIKHALKFLVLFLEKIVFCFFEG